MRKIKVETHPDASRLSKLKVDIWPEWKKGNTEIPWKYIEDETSYILEGRAIITPEGGDPVEISKGNLVTIPCGTTCVMKILEPMRKRYRIGSA